MKVVPIRYGVITTDMMRSIDHVLKVKFTKGTVQFVREGIRVVDSDIFSVEWPIFEQLQKIAVSSGEGTGL